MRYLFILSGVVCLSFMSLPACAPQPEQQAEPVAQEAPRTEADVEAISQVLEEWEAAGKASDTDGLMSLFGEGAIWMPPNETEITDREAIRVWFQKMFDQLTVDEYAIVSDEVVVSGEWAFQRGNYTQTLSPKAGGEPFQEAGKFIVILEKQSDGSWKWARGIWNSNNPPTEEPTT